MNMMELTRKITAINRKLEKANKINGQTLGERANKKAMIDILTSDMLALEEEYAGLVELAKEYTGLDAEAGAYSKIEMEFRRKYKKKFSDLTEEARGEYLKKLEPQRLELAKRSDEYKGLTGKSIYTNEGDKIVCEYLQKAKGVTFGI